MTVSLWNRRPTKNTLQTDVVIVGAGIAGIAAALHLQQRNIQHLVVERHQPGAGASTRNAGFLMRGAADNYAFACDTLGHDRTRLLWQWTEENLALLRAWGIDSIPSYRAIPSCLVALDDREADELTRSARLLRDDGFDTDIIRAHTDVIWQHPRTRLALINPYDATINPRHLVDALAARIDPPILSDSPVFAIDLDNPDHILAHTARATIHASRILICTNAWTAQLLPDYASRIVPNRGQMLALHAPDTPSLSYAYYLNRGGEYIRRPDASTITVGGWRRHFQDQERTLTDETADNLQQGLEQFAFEMLGARFPVTARWCGHMAFTHDGIPIVEPLPHNPRAVVCSGFTGHGMSLGARTARAAVDLVLDETPFPLAADRFSGVTHRTDPT